MTFGVPASDEKEEVREENRKSTQTRATIYAVIHSQIPQNKLFAVASAAADLRKLAIPVDISRERLGTRTSLRLRSAVPVFTHAATLIKGKRQQPH